METDQRRIEVYQEYPLPYELYCERDTFKYHYIVSIICNWYINISKFENHLYVLKESDIARLDYSDLFYVECLSLFFFIFIIIYIKNYL